MSRRVWVLLSTLALFVLLESRAHAEEPIAVQLDFAAANDSTCPDERTFRDLVAARMGYEPFQAAAPARVTVRIVVRRGAPSGTLALRDPAGHESRRELVGRAGECGDLGQALAVTLAIMLDPLGEHVTPPSVPPTATPTLAPPPAPTTALPEVPAPIAAPPAAPTTHVDVGVGALLSLGLVPGVALGGRAQASLRRHALSASLAARYETTSGTVSIAGDRAEASLIAAALASCFARGILQACAAASLGSYAARLESVTSPITKRTPFADLSLRGALVLPVTARLALLISLEARVPLTTANFVVDDRTIFTTAPILGTFAIGPSFELF